MGPGLQFADAVSVFLEVALSHGVPDDPDQSGMPILGQTPVSDNIWQIFRGRNPPPQLLNPQMFVP